VPGSSLVLTGTRTLDPIPIVVCIGRGTL